LKAVEYLLELVALAFQELQDIQGLQRRQPGDVDLLQLVADLVVADLNLSPHAKFYRFRVYRTGEVQKLS
jgi:hypothetical protein